MNENRLQKEITATEWKLNKMKQDLAVKIEHFRALADANDWEIVHWAKTYGERVAESAVDVERLTNQLEMLQAIAGEENA